MPGAHLPALNRDCCDIPLFDGGGGASAPPSLFLFQNYYFFIFFSLFFSLSGSTLVVVVAPLRGLTLALRTCMYIYYGEWVDIYSNRPRQGYNLLGKRRDQYSDNVVFLYILLFNFFSTKKI